MLTASSSGFFPCHFVFLTLFNCYNLDSSPDCSSLQCSICSCRDAFMYCSHLRTFLHLCLLVCHHLYPHKSPSSRSSLLNMFHRNAARFCNCFRSWHVGGICCQASWNWLWLKGRPSPTQFIPVASLIPKLCQLCTVAQCSIFFQFEATDRLSSLGRSALSLISGFPSLPLPSSGQCSLSALSAVACKAALRCFLPDDIL